jgi:hypothetical protein
MVKPMPINKSFISSSTVLRGCRCPNLRAFPGRVTSIASFTIDFSKLSLLNLSSWLFIKAAVFSLNSLINCPALGLSDLSNLLRDFKSSVISPLRPVSFTFRSVNSLNDVRLLKSAFILSYKFFICSSMCAFLSW